MCSLVGKGHVGRRCLGRPCAAWRSGLSRSLSRYDDDNDDDDDDDNDGDEGDDEDGDHVTDDDDDDYDDDCDVLCLSLVVMLICIFKEITAITGFSPENETLLSMCLTPNEILLLMYLSWNCLLYTSPSPRDRTRSRMPSSA